MMSKKDENVEKQKVLRSDRREARATRLFACGLPMCVGREDYRVIVLLQTSAADM